MKNVKLKVKHVKKRRGGRDFRQGVEETHTTGFEFVTLPHGGGHRVTSVHSGYAPDGVHPGDYIVRVNGRDVQGVAHEEVKLLMRKQVCVCMCVCVCVCV